MSMRPLLSCTVILAFAALAFLGLVKGGTKLRFTLPKDPGWLDSRGAQEFEFFYGANCPRISPPPLLTVWMLE